MKLIEKEGLYDGELPDDDQEVTEDKGEAEEIVLIGKKQPESSPKPLVENLEDEDDDEFFEVNQEAEEESSIFTLRKPK